ncbi:MAG: hypothetical protein V1826_01805 [bacterium]
MTVENPSAGAEFPDDIESGLESKRISEDEIKLTREQREAIGETEPMSEDKDCFLASLRNFEKYVVADEPGTETDDSALRKIKHQKDKSGKPLYSADAGISVKDAAKVAELNQYTAITINSAEDLMKELADDSDKKGAVIFIGNGQARHSVLVYRDPSNKEHIILRDPNPSSPIGEDTLHVLPFSLSVLEGLVGLGKPLKSGDPFGHVLVIGDVETKAITGSDKAAEPKATLRTRGEREAHADWTLAEKLADVYGQYRPESEELYGIEVRHIAEQVGERRRELSAGQTKLAKDFQAQLAEAWGEKTADWAEDEKTGKPVSLERHLEQRWLSMFGAKDNELSPADRQRKHSESAKKQWIKNESAKLREGWIADHFKAIETGLTNEAIAAVESRLIVDNIIALEQTKLIEAGDAEYIRCIDGLIARVESRPAYTAEQKARQAAAIKELEDRKAPLSEKNDKQVKSKFSLAQLEMALYAANPDYLGIDGKFSYDSGDETEPIEIVEINPDTNKPEKRLVDSHLVMTDFQIEWDLVAMRFSRLLGEKTIRSDEDLSENPTTPQELIYLGQHRYRTDLRVAREANNLQTQIRRYGRVFEDLTRLEGKTLSQARIAEFIRLRERQSRLYANIVKREGVLLLLHIQKTKEAASGHPSA